MTIIFDLDGTLLNTIDDLGYACNHALGQTGYPTFPIEAYPAKVGNGINNLIRRALPESERTEEKVMKVREFFVPYYNAHNCDYTRPYEGIPELLKALKAQGHQLAVASNKYQAATEKIVEHFFPGVFDVILGEREGIERKPNPQIVYDIVKSLNCSTVQSLYVGDSLVDRDTAANANVPFVACSWGFVSREALVGNGVGRIVDKPEELLLDVYIHEHILPQYDNFDGGHKRDHAETVIQESLKLARAYDADETMAYVIAAYHDLGLKFDREKHHIHSGEILMADEHLRQWFTHDQLLTMRDAVEDHRASGKNPPRTIYGAIVAEADRQIDPLTVVHRTMAYSQKLYPDGDFETLYQRSLDHLHEKYAEGGYLKLWLNSERNVQGLAQLRAMIKNEPELRNLCREWFDKQPAPKVLRYLEEHGIAFTVYYHPEGKTIEEAKRWWHDDGSVHCKNIFMRNHKGDQHYLICFPCDYDLAIHDIEHWLKDVLVSQGLKAPGKLSFASPERMMKYLGLEPGSVSPFGLINDTEHHVILFLDSRLKEAESLSFHPNDCRGTVVISQAAFQQYLACVGNKVEYITTC